MESIQGGRYVSRSNKQTRTVLPRFHSHCSSRTQDYEDATESARKICENKGLPEFCKCKTLIPIRHHEHDRDHNHQYHLNRINDNHSQMERWTRLRSSDVQHWQAWDKHLGKVTIFEQWDKQTNSISIISSKVLA